MRRLLCICCFFSISLLYGQVDLSAFQYRELGPSRGGRVTAVAGVASQPNVFYMGSTGGGVWKTEDYGTTWENISDGYFMTPSIGAIRVAASDSDVIYVGTGSDGLRSNVITGKGVYKSTDAGKTWTHVGLKNVGQIGAVEIHPTNPDVVYVAAIGQAFQANPERGVFRSINGGDSWEKVLFLSDQTGFADLELKPGDPNTIYAAAWHAERKPWTIISGGTENGIYKSMDGGDNWTKLEKDLPQGIVGKIDLAVSPANSQLLYALIEAPDGANGVYRSEDAGASFEHVSDMFALTQRAFYYVNIEADPKNPDIVYAPVQTNYKSTDGGRSWSRLNTPHGDNHDIWINPHNTDLYIQANDGGVNVTHNGGKTWSTQLNQPTAELYQVEVDDQYPYWLYAGQQDNYTTVSVPSIAPYSHQAGALGLVMNTGGCETGPAVPKPGNPDIVYANCKGKFSVYNKRTGQEKQYFVGAQYIYGHNPKDLNFRFQRVSPIHVSPHDPDVVYHCSQYVHKTTNDGQSWEIISPDLTAFEPDKQVISGGPITRDITGEEFYSTIYSIRESALEKGLIWVGANDGPVHVTRDGGKNWTKVTPASLPSGGRVDAVEPSPHSASKAYISVLRYQLGDWQPYIYRTNDYGQSWTLLTTGQNGIPADHPTRVIREDPDRAGLLYAGTEFGLYISFDDGASWQPFQQNLPLTPITDIKVHRQDLVLSTMGRGFWVMDDLTPLHQGYADMQRAQTKLFQPNTSIRYRSKRGFPGDSRAAAYINYYLAEASDEPLRLEIRSQDGELVRAFSSEQGGAMSQDSADMSTNEVFYAFSSQLKNEPGLHRFAWDFRHAGPWDARTNRRYQGGPMAAPGTYRVRLLHGDDVQEQTLVVKADPKVLDNGTSEEDLLAQEALALQIVQQISEARQLAQQVETDLNQLERMQKRKKLNKEQMARHEELLALQTALVRPSGHYTQPMLISQLEYLYGIIRQADQRPGRDVYERYEVLKKELADLKK